MWDENAQFEQSRETVLTFERRHTWFELSTFAYDIWIWSSYKVYTNQVLLFRDTRLYNRWNKIEIEYRSSFVVDFLIKIKKKKKKENFGGISSSRFFHHIFLIAIFEPIGIDYRMVDVKGLPLKSNIIFVEYLLNTGFRK